MDELEQMKRFKEFEIKLADAGKQMHMLMVGSCNNPDNAKKIAEIRQWHRIVKSYNMAEIKWAVYDSPTAENWQVFRIGLKGLTTKQKLYMLDMMLERTETMSVTAMKSSISDFTAVQKERDLNYIRVDNYLGALVRGGQLNIIYEVQR